MDFLPLLLPARIIRERNNAKNVIIFYENSIWLWRRSFSHPLMLQVLSPTKIYVEKGTFMCNRMIKKDFGIFGIYCFSSVFSERKTGVERGNVTVKNGSLTLQLVHIKSTKISVFFATFYFLILGLQFVEFSLQIYVHLFVGRFFDRKTVAETKDFLGCLYLLWLICTRIPFSLLQIHIANKTNGNIYDNLIKPIKRTKNKWVWINCIKFAQTCIRDKKCFATWNVFKTLTQFLICFSFLVILAF